MLVSQLYIILHTTLHYLTGHFFSLAKLDYYYANS
jgi:hypothetical protein